MRKERTTGIPGTITWKQGVVLAMLPVLTALVALCIGRMAIHPADVVSSILAKFGVGAPLSLQMETVLWSMRFPRILLACLVGAGLSVAGCTFQSLFSNPLATPDTLGVASGASFGAAAALLFGLGMVGVQLSALAFGVLAVALTTISCTKLNGNRATPILAGIMVGALFNALVSLVKFTADTESQLPEITYWLMGNLESADYFSLVLGAPPILLSILVLWLLRWQMNLLPLAEDEATTSGVNVRLLRRTAQLCATVTTASCVSMCGQVGWVGLLVPHICRMKLGSSHVSLIPASVSIGACFMILVDTAARAVSAKEIPVSILTAIIGAPFFIFLMRRSKGWSL
ncbi:MAG: iron ABC transporter permease [Clostridium sp.]|nr:iron ABC transporter permease [Clostridium sp.]